MSFHSWQSFFISFFHVSLGLPGPRLPSIGISHAVLTAPLERSTYPNQQILRISTVPVTFQVPKSQVIMQMITSFLANFRVMGVGGGGLV